jgi:GNAT superfamily N-acetyltransferase
MQMGYPSGSARIRAMYTDPVYARLGLGRAILAVCEVSARPSGHCELELLATPIGKFSIFHVGLRRLKALKFNPKTMCVLKTLESKKHSTTR